MMKICFILVACIALAACNHTPEPPSPAPNTDTPILKKNNFSVSVHFKYSPNMYPPTADSIPIDTTYLDDLAVEGDRDTIKVYLQHGLARNVETLVYVKTANDTALYTQAYPDYPKQYSFRYHIGSQKVVYSFYEPTNHNGTHQYVCQSY